MTSCDVREATHVKHGGQWHRIASKWGIDDQGHLAKPSEGGFGCVTEAGLRIDMMNGEAYRNGRAEGIEQITGAPWVSADGCLEMQVNDEKGNVVLAWLTMRPPYCDRGHIQLNIDGPLELDRADSFPRYFFSFDEADAHTRAFLKWRLWKEWTHSDAAIWEAFQS